jgi:LmbE family N-acetylglucosaminyl deacetylase
MLWMCVGIKFHRKDNFMNVLAIGAHPDDIEAYCAGTLARYSRAGEKVFMCVVTDGRGRPAGDPDEIAHIRKGEAQASADLIGAELIWMAIPDGQLMVDDATRHQFGDVIRQTTPDIIITHPPMDYHPDHNATNQLVMDASQVARTSNYQTKLPAIRKPVPVAFMSSELGLNYQPEEYVDISDVWEVKREMLLQHRSQHMPGPMFDANWQPEDPDALPIMHVARVMSEFYGLACNVRYAEPFCWWRAANRVVARRVLP